MILEWIEREIKPMRRSRQKTLAAIITAAMQMQGVGVLALGRAMRGAARVKQNIKRVRRFFRNEALGIIAIQQALCNRAGSLRGRKVVLFDWTDLRGYKTLVAALPRDGRAIPVWWKSIGGKSGDGGMCSD